MCERMSFLNAAGMECARYAAFWRDARLKEQEDTHKDEKGLQEAESKYLRRGNQKTVVVFLKHCFANWVVKYKM